MDAATGGDVYGRELIPARRTDGKSKWAEFAGSGGYFENTYGIRRAENTSNESTHVE